MAVPLQYGRKFLGHLMQESRKNHWGQKEHTLRRGQIGNKQILSHHHPSHCLISNYLVNFMGSNSLAPHFITRETEFCTTKLRKSSQVESNFFFQSSLPGLSPAMMAKVLENFVSFDCSRNCCVSPDLVYV